MHLQAPEGALPSSGVVVEQGDGCLYVKASCSCMAGIHLTASDAPHAAIGRTQHGALVRVRYHTADILRSLQVNCKDRRGLLSDIIMSLKAIPLEVGLIMSLSCCNGLAC